MHTKTELSKKDPFHEQLGDLCLDGDEYILEHQGEKKFCQWVAMVETALRPHYLCSVDQLHWLPVDNLHPLDDLGEVLLQLLESLQSTDHVKSVSFDI